MSSAGGIIWTVASAFALALNSSATEAENAASQQQALALAQSQPSGSWRPPQWSNAPQTSITLTSAASVSTSQVDNLTSGPLANQSANSTSSDTSSLIYVFDAILRAEHNRQLRMTEHPVQTGASISDHAFLLPSEVTLEIGMSDAMQAFTAGVFTSNKSKSISAFETLVALQEGAQPLTVTTRLATYQNMLIESIHALDTKATIAGLRATVVFREIFTGTVTATPVSARPQTTDSTNIGTKPSLTPPSTISTFTPTSTSTVPGAGVLSSTPITGS
jgi:hypothetical protein